MAMTLLCLLGRYRYRVYQICLVVSLCKKGLLLADRFLTAWLACARLAQLPKLLELVGLGYTAWFVYRYLLFKV